MNRAILELGPGGVEKITRLELSDEDGGRVFEVSDGKSGIWYFAGILEAIKKFVEITIDDRDDNR
ncbi:MAG: hypothetical protein AB3N63_04860 [Puniceicoccaceae bacterium]